MLGTHELEEIFTRQALELEQWRSRFHAGQALPGISEEEATEIVHSELGLELSQRKIQKLIAKSRITDLRNGGQHSYVSARRLFWVIRELQAVTNGESTRLASTMRVREPAAAPHQVAHRFRPNPSRNAAQSKPDPGFESTSLRHKVSSAEKLS